MRVEQLAQRSGVSVDTIRYYQSKGLLDPPRREGRVAWYGKTHLERLARVRALQQRGFSLATIARLVSGELDAADEALLGELSGADRATGAAPDGTSAEADRVGIESFTLDELAIRTGVPLPLLKSVEAEGLLVPRRVAGQERYTAEDVEACRAGLVILEWGVPLSALLEVARDHGEATDGLARAAVELFSEYVRDPVHRTGDPDATTLLEAYAALLPAVTTLVSYHFTRTLLKAALDHVERTGSDDELRAVTEQVGVGGNASTTAGVSRGR